MTLGKILQKSASSIFPKEKILKMGVIIETILAKEKITQKERNILKHLKTYLLFRKNFFKKKDNYYYTENLKETEKKLPFATDEVLALNFWARGSRNSPNELLPERDSEELYEKIEKKLNPPRKD